MKKEEYVKNLFYKKLDTYRFETITCHWVMDVDFIKNYLQERNINAKILLMSHSPEPFSKEAYHHMLINKCKNATDEYLKLQNIEKEAFLKADIVIFPSEEAMEPYMVLDYFEEIIKPKTKIFINTGCM